MRRPRAMHASLNKEPQHGCRKSHCCAISDRERGTASISKIIFQYNAIRGQALPFAALLEAAALPAPAVAAGEPGVPHTLRLEFSLPFCLKRLALFIQAP